MKESKNVFKGRSNSNALVLFLVLSCSFGINGQLCTSNGKCDKHELCSAWREADECLKNPIYMLEHCPASCEGEKRESDYDEKGVDGNPNCVDKHKFCSIWASKGECEENEINMKKFCAKSCNACDSVLDVDDVQDSTENDEMEAEENDEMEAEEDDDSYCTNKHESCDVWAKAGECETNPNYMEVNCPKSCKTCEKVEPIVDPQESRYMLLAKASEKFGVKQQVTGAQRSKVAERLQESIHYLEDPQTKQLPEKVLKECQNRNELCAFWATIGECEKNQGYMTTNCAPSCKTCNLIDLEVRCPMNLESKPALYPGSLNKMFSRIVKTAPGNQTELSIEEKRQLEESNMTIYTVNVLSGPEVDSKAENTVAMDKSSPPWVITFDDFLTEDECQTLIDFGSEFKYKRSEDVGAVRFDGSHEGVQSESRTSENAWCSTHEGCRSREIPQRIHDRIAKVLNIPAVNSEDFQMLKYEKGQFYRTHHDFIDHQVDRQCGPRILTFFLYLNDVEAGGGTNFPKLGLTVMPKRGRALLWPSVLNSAPMKSDQRTDHQALDVEAGTKYAANGWIHMYDYMTPQKKGCA